MIDYIDAVMSLPSCSDAGKGSKVNMVQGWIKTKKKNNMISTSVTPNMFVSAKVFTKYKQCFSALGPLIFHPTEKCI